MAIEIIRHKDDTSWLNYRAKGIGSSEVGTILGVNKWQTPYGLWQIKKGHTHPKEETIATRIGHELEPFVAQLYEEATGNKIDKATEGNWSIRNDIRPYTIASPDRICTSAKDGHSILLECKTTQQPIDENNLPPSWFCQVQYLLACSGLKDGAIAWIVGNRDFGTKRIIRDDNFLKWMFERLDKFWYNCIVNNTPPEPTNVEDIEIMFPHPNPRKSIEANEKICKTIEVIRAKQQEFGRIKKELDDLKCEVRTYMTDAHSLTINGQIAATLTEYTSNRLDGQKLKAEMPDLYAKYTRSDSATTLRFK